MNAVGLVYAVFVVTALAGLLAAKRPDIFAQYFLAKWQRDRLADNMSGLSWTGWAIFAFAVFAAIVTLIAEQMYR